MEINKIYEHIKILEVEPKKFTNIKWPVMNKNNTLKEYQEEIDKKTYTVNYGGYDNTFSKEQPTYNLQDAVATKEVYFDNIEAYNYFCNHLLTDFDFLAGTGGTGTDDERIKTYQDYISMSKEERETVIFYRCDCVAIYLHNEFKFIIDAQGYSYARYVGLK